MPTKEEVKFDTSGVFGEENLRQKQLKIRVEEVEALANEIKGGACDKMFGSSTLDFDFDKFVVAGHSFGGIAALQTAFEKKAFASICLDPWYLPVHESVNKSEYRLDGSHPPTLVVNTEHFSAEMEVRIGNKVYNQRGCSDKFKDESDKAGGRLEQCEMKDSLHIN